MKPAGGLMRADKKNEFSTITKLSRFVTFITTVTQMEIIFGLYWQPDKNCMRNNDPFLKKKETIFIIYFLKIIK